MPEPEDHPTRSPRKSVPARLPEPTYAALASASNVLNESMNTVLTRAVQYYVKEGGLASDVAKAQAAQNEAIRKLSGE